MDGHRYQSKKCSVLIENNRVKCIHLQRPKISLPDMIKGLWVWGVDEIKRLPIKFSLLLLLEHCNFTNITFSVIFVKR